MNTIKSDSFRNHVDQLMSEYHVPGVAIAVFNDEAVDTAAFGHSSLDPNVPITKDTIFDVASMSKSFTAASILKLVTDSTYRISLQTPVSDILPQDFVLPDAWATANVTVEDILCHRSGMPGHDDSSLGVESKQPDTVESITRNLRNLYMNTSPRTTFQYNNTMYTVATYIVEKLTGQKFSQFLQEQFFDILRMTSSYLQPSAALASKRGTQLSTPYAWSDERQRYVRMPRQETPELQGAGSIQSTIVDYAKWLQAMIKQSEAPLSQEMYDQLTTGRMLADPDNKDRQPFTSFGAYALGWEVNFYRGHEVVFHGGGIPGYTSFMFFLPAIKSGMVIMTNISDADGLIDTLVQETIDEILNIPQPDRIDWTTRFKERKLTFANDFDTRHDDLRQEILLETGNHSSSEQRLPLSAYIGTYSNTGYHDITISIDDEQLYIDARDRSDPWTITLEHISANTHFIAHQRDYENLVAYRKATFRIGSVVEAIGINLVSEDEEYLVWFDRRT